MNNKVLVLGCNTSQIPYIEEINKQGYKIIGVDKNIEAPGKSLCHTFYNFGYDDIEQLIKMTQYENLNSTGKVFTAGAQFAYIGLSKVCEEAKINFPTTKTIEMCLDKKKFYEEFEKNGIRIPETQYVTSSSELQLAIKNMSNRVTHYYLKSDHSKNPNYIYQLTNDANVEKMEINWKKDRYFRQFYILQEEFFGTHVRLNIYGNNGNVYLFDGSNIRIPGQQVINQVKESGVIFTLHQFLIKHNLSRFLVKFDIVINSVGEYVVLDIGLDPPFRMMHHFTDQGNNFFENYIDQYLNNQITYPILENCICF